jgi:hypothetical protein
LNIANITLFFVFRLSNIAKLFLCLLPFGYQTLRNFFFALRHTISDNREDMTFSGAITDNGSREVQLGLLIYHFVDLVSCYESGSNGNKN